MYILFLHAPHALLLKTSDSSQNFGSVLRVCVVKKKLYSVFCIIGVLPNQWHTKWLVVAFVGAKTLIKFKSGSKWLNLKE